MHLKSDRKKNNEISQKVTDVNRLQKHDKASPQHSPKCSHLQGGLHTAELLHRCQYCSRATELLKAKRAGCGYLSEKEHSLKTLCEVLNTSNDVQWAWIARLQTEQNDPAVPALHTSRGSSMPAHGSWWTTSFLFAIWRLCLYMEGSGQRFPELRYKWIVIILPYHSSNLQKQM